MRSLSTLPTLSVVVLLVLGCGAGDDPVIEGPDDVVEDPGEEPSDVTGEPGGQANDLDLAELADRAAADAAEEAGVDVDEVTVLTSEAVTWPDGALGCPDEDGMYTQALVEGYRVIVEVDGQQVHYHGAVGEAPFRCDDPEEPVEGEDPVEEADAQLDEGSSG